MELTEQTEADVRHVVDAFWTTYLEGDLEALIPLLGDDFTQVGSADGEVFFDKTSAVQFIYDTIDQISGKVDIRDRSTRFFAYGDSVFVIDLFNLYVLSDGSWILYAKHRASMLLREADGVWRIAHLHASIPDARTEEGDNLAIENVAAENVQLREAVRRRTIELESKNEELESAKADVEAALVELRATHAQLVQQEKMAALGQLTMGIAHQIKNPLNFVNNFAELNVDLAHELREALACGDDYDEIIDDLNQNAKRISHYGKRADGIVHTMMQHASGGTGQREPTNINALVLQHVGLAYHGKRAQLPDLTVDIKQDLGADVGPVEVVPQEVGRVLLNLLSNAFDAVYERAAEADGEYAPTVTVSTKQVSGRVEIRVSDNGPGIAPEVEDKVFDPFFTTKPMGTGLGLSLSYDIVAHGHGGTLTVESREGEGTAFLVTLPVDQRAATPSVKRDH
jgi:signal transduction histidine kinase